MTLWQYDQGNRKNSIYQYNKLNLREHWVELKQVEAQPRSGITYARAGTYQWVIL